MGLVAGWIGRLSGKSEREKERRRTGEAPDVGDVYIYGFCSTGGRGARKSIVNVNEVHLRYKCCCFAGA